MTTAPPGFWSKLDMTAIGTFIGIVALFAGAVIVTLWLPRHVDPSWTQPTTPYQVQMYTVADPHFYLSSAPKNPTVVEAVYYLQPHTLLLAFQESTTVRILAPSSLEKYITRWGEPGLKLTTELLLLRVPQKTEAFDATEQAIVQRQRLQKEWQSTHQVEEMPNFVFWELYAPTGTDAFAVAAPDTIFHSWVDKGYQIIDQDPQLPYATDGGVIYVANPVEYRVRRYPVQGREVWRYDPEGEVIASLDELRGSTMGFRSRRELIRLGEQIYAHEGCWYCHTDQTRTLVQDVVLNGGASYPAPPSSPNEYIYDEVTFPGTHRIGPDLSRTGIKRPSRDWHRSHFWSPKSASLGSIMPAFQHFFDDDPRGTAGRTIGVPNVRFEAIYQYLMTKGTRITPPSQGWWLGKDPIDTKAIIEGRRGSPP